MEANVPAVQLLRHATLRIRVGNQTLLVDPMLSEPEAIPPIPNSPNDRRNPLVPLPETNLKEFDGLLVTHIHRDHLDDAAKDALPKDLPLFCQPEDETELGEEGFEHVRPIDETESWDTVEFIRTGGRHGTGEIGEQMGPVSGFVMQVTTGAEPLDRTVMFCNYYTRYVPNIESGRTDSVPSHDGTTIGYRQFGEGPGLILVHGGARSSYNFTDLGGALSDAFSVYILDRRGRGLSGSPGEDYSIETECEDIDAIRSETDARYIFGLSSGGLAALQAARTFPTIEKVAAYEPPLFTARINPIDWGERFEREIAQGKLGNATITLAEGVEGFPRPLRLIPRSLLAPLISGLLKVSDRLGGADTIPVSDLIQTMKYDIQMVRQAQLTPQSFSDLSAEVLLLGGSKSPAFLRTTLDEVNAVLPCATRVEFDGLGHTGPENSGEPERVAQELRRFFS